MCTAGGQRLGERAQLGLREAQGLAVRGVGRWTAEMLLIFTLGRPDVLPVDDFGVRYGFKLLYAKRQMPKPAALAKYGERWAPFRSTASWYLWRLVDSAKKSD